MEWNLRDNPFWSNSKRNIFGHLIGGWGNFDQTKFVIGDKIGESNHLYIIDFEKLVSMFNI